MNGTFSEKEIFSVDTTIAVISTPVIDENTGELYFFSSPNLVKVNPATGTSSIVNTYTNVVPHFLQYVPSDGMFYGVNVYSTPYTFIRIDPETGDVASLAQMSYFILGNMGQTFDYCSNLYILYGAAATYWINPLNGEVVKQSNIGLEGTYVNASLP